MRLVLTLSLTALLAGCSLFGKEDGTEPMELVDFEPTAKVDRVWKRSSGVGQGDGHTRLEPAIHDGLLYAVDYRGELTVIDRSSGKIKWDRDLDELLAGGVGIGGGKILLGTDEGEVLALDINDGAELWRAQLNSEIMSTPAGDSNVVAAHTLDGRLTVLDASTGEELWFYDNPPPKLTLRGRSAPVVTDSAIYAGFSNGRLMAFNPQNGLILWEQRVAMPKGRSDLEKMVDIQATPVLVDGILYVSGYQGRLMAVSRATGRPLWAVDSSSYQELWFDNSELFVTEDNSAVVAYDANSGTESWRNEQMLRRLLTGPASVGQYVAVADDDGYIHILNRSDGSFAARTNIDGSGVRAPLWSDGELLYVLANDGKLAAYRISPK